MKNKNANPELLNLTSEQNITNNIKATISNSILDISNINKNTKDIIYIPLKKKNIYKPQLNDIYNFVMDETPNVYPKYSVYLFMKAIEGHNILMYDNCYNYFVGVVVNETKPTLVKKDITDKMTQEGIDYVQDVLWKNRDICEYLKLKTEECLKDKILNNSLYLYSHCILNNEYNAIWKSVENSILLVNIKNYDEKTPDIQYKLL